MSEQGATDIVGDQAQLMDPPDSGFLGRLPVGLAALPGFREDPVGQRLDQLVLIGEEPVDHRCCRTDLATESPHGESVESLAVQDVHRRIQQHLAGDPLRSWHDSLLPPAEVLLESTLFTSLLPLGEQR
jgi:hypothetical protein